MNETLTIITLAGALALFIGLPIVEMLRTGDDSTQRKADNARCAARRADENAKRLADRTAAEKSLERFNRAQTARAALRNRYNT